MASRTVAAASVPVGGDERGHAHWGKIGPYAHKPEQKEAHGDEVTWLFGSRGGTIRRLGSRFILGITNDGEDADIRLRS